ncbi:hypothetical protein [Acidipila rosea]|uniref:Transmembrane protein n=1 Tax=Acidipila rosea TaxID=768535 RepID=A0A4R1L6B1_9BACT|nr:hypothetical protein [Acidipila rosea]MBW4026782.1 hypothetical protein [Acidobacteriota bacterium]MBW4043361.1 hypothetical protein [Acidobacteriota bacterium]TCK73664.1 hypothetical protein C7378_1277 [Acidipila rosea]
MARLTISFGIVLILLGLFSFMATGAHAPTSLIPAFAGLLLVIFGFLARTDDVKKRMLHMHIAVTIGLLGFLGTAKALVDFVRMKQGVQFARPVAVEEKAAMAALLLVYVVLCVRSFIAARRARA